MATTYLSTQIGHTSGIGLSMGPTVETFSLTVPAAGFGNGDVIVMAQIPYNAAILTFYISSPALDSNVSPAATWEIGDTTTVGKYVASGSTGPQGAVNTLAHQLNGFVAGSLPSAVYTTQTSSVPSGVTLGTTSSVMDYLQIKFTHAPATAVTSGTITGFVLYTLNKVS